MSRDDPSLMTRIINFLSGTFRAINFGNCYDWVAALVSRHIMVEDYEVLITSFQQRNPLSCFAGCLEFQLKTSFMLLTINLCLTFGISRETQTFSHSVQKFKNISGINKNSCKPFRSRIFQSIPISNDNAHSRGSSCAREKHLHKFVHFIIALKCLIYSFTNMKKKGEH